MASSRFTLTWNIQADDQEKLIKEFLKENDVSSASLTDIKFRGGSILVGGAEVNVLYRLKEGDTLEVFFPLEEPSQGMAGENIPLEILYEDDYLLVVNKPPDMNTIPSREHPKGSLANALIGYYQSIGLIATTHIVTRLDRDTSGIVLVAKHRHVHHLFSKLQKQGKVKRTYEAFAQGLFVEKTGSVIAPIGRKPDSIIEREVRSDGQYAATHYKVLREIGQAFSHLKLSLETGRTHQIRVHMSYVGHPLLGDTLYGGSVGRISRQALHCLEISFVHPFYNEQMTFRADMPADMATLLHT
ncbi:RNA pseudouridine synthase [Bacillus sp. FJAT-27225]|uniref:RluA family pseudouridine synthase n=1 Tax=Bacillus sp. FJAT-27225 TaxID=1743144 RepID=UPI00080C2DB2|nr:RluA family pseudouridine synthase [Bacillus sp. FJAT-27225]OCA84244.1 RNA pseudouridine synthase [Bacillus sp. FJAT-27225]